MHMVPPLLQMKKLVEFRQSTTSTHNFKTNWNGTYQNSKKWLHSHLILYEKVSEAWQWPPAHTPNVNCIGLITKITASTQTFIANCIENTQNSKNTHGAPFNTNEKACRIQAEYNQHTHNCKTNCNGSCQNSTKRQPSHLILYEKVKEMHGNDHQHTPPMSTASVWSQR